MFRRSAPPLMPMLERTICAAPTWIAVDIIDLGSYTDRCQMPETLLGSLTRQAGFWSNESNELTLDLIVQPFVRGKSVFSWLGINVRAACNSALG
jgi:hypothetical protein